MPKLNVLSRPPEPFLKVAAVLLFLFYVWAWFWISVYHWLSVSPPRLGAGARAWFGG